MSALVPPKPTPKDSINYNSQDWKHVRDELTDWLSMQSKALERDQSEAETAKTRGIIQTLRRILAWEEIVAKKFRNS